MKLSRFFIILIIVLPLESFSQFRAKMINVVNGKETNYEVYSGLKQYRYDFVEDGMKGVVIVILKQIKQRFCFRKRSLYTKQPVMA